MSIDCAGLAEVLVKVIGQQIDVGKAVNSSRLYPDVKTDTIRYNGNCLYHHHRYRMGFTWPK